MTRIGHVAFCYCTSLLGESLISEGVYEPLTFGAGLTEIKYRAFYGCSNLTSVTIPDSVTSIGDSAFNDCKYLRWVTIQGGATVIGDSAFASCDSLTSVSIPGGALSIGEHAFSDCKKLTNVTISAGLTSIGAAAFSTCFSLNRITIPGTVTSIGAGAFSEYGCQSLADVSYGGTEAQWETVDVGTGNDALYAALDFARGSCGAQGDNLTWALGANGVLSISGSGDMADFNSQPPWVNLQDGIVSVFLPEGLTSIGNSAFSECWRMKSITIPEKVTRIGKYTFSSCGSLKEITIPGRVGVIGNHAFDRCIGLTAATIKSGVSEIGDHAFYRCNALTTLTLPKSVTSIGGNAFNSSASLSDIYYDGSMTEWNSISVGSGNEPLLAAALHLACGAEGLNLTWTLDQNGVLIITGSGAMADYHLNEAPWANYQDSVLAVELKPGVTSIGRAAFRDFGSLATVTIPVSLASIGLSAFDGTNLADVYYEGSHADWTGTEIAMFNDALCEAAMHYAIHEYGDPLWTWAEDFSSAMASFRCFDCGDTQMVDAEITSEATAASCDAAGKREYTATVQFLENAYWDSKTVTISALGHDWGVPVYTWSEDNSTVTASRTCSHDGSHMETETVSTTSVVSTPASGESYGELTYTAIFANPAFTEQTKTVEISPPEIIASGTCGEGLTWTLNSEGQLTVSGTGPMADYGFGEQPWSSYGETIESVVIEEGAALALLKAVVLWKVFVYRRDCWRSAHMPFMGIMTA